MSNKSKRARTKLRIVQQTSSKSNKVVSEAVKSEIASKVIRPTAGVSSAAMYLSKYQHIKPELIRIGVIAAVLFIIIFVLTFIIQ